MNKLTNCFEGIDLNLGLVVLKFKKPNVSEITIARESRRRNEYFRVSHKRLFLLLKFFVWIDFGQ
ncbi:hypothetical protein COE72_14165 [Bacillus toyonensis]|nr:hypothetical protein COE72_14165 [Bacillus toyonensis]